MALPRSDARRVISSWGCVGVSKKKRATWWKMFYHQRAAIESVSDADVGSGLKAAFRYFDGENIDFSAITPAACTVFCVMRPYIDEANADYAASVEHGRDGGNRRWGKTDTPPIPPLTTPMGLPREAEADADAEVRKDSLAQAQADFDLFWQAYPKKRAKQAAFRAFSKKPHPPIGVLVAAIERQKKAEQWQRDGGQFIPYPATWLNGGCWDDETGQESACAAHTPELVQGEDGRLHHVFHFD